MARRELEKRLRCLEDEARRRAAMERPRPARSEPVEWERTLKVLDAFYGVRHDPDATTRLRDQT